MRPPSLYRSVTKSWLSRRPKKERFTGLNECRLRCVLCRPWSVFAGSQSINIRALHRGFQNKNLSYRRA